MTPTTTPFLARKFRALDAELMKAVPRVVHGKDGEAIHDLRVAIRRLRTLLKMSRRVYGRRHSDAVRQAFAAIQRATGNLRDEEVLRETFSELPEVGPSFTRWVRGRMRRERQLRREVTAHLKSGELQRARAMLRGLLVLPAKPKKSRDIYGFARGCVERARGGVEQMRDVPASDVEGLHELRIAYKELRYATELLKEALPTDLAAMGEPAARFQKRLGEIHDVDVALATVGRARFDLTERSLVTSLLDALRTKRVGKYVAEMTPEVDALPADPSAEGATGPRGPVEPSKTAPTATRAKRPRNPSTRGH